MIERLKRLVRENKERQKKIMAQNAEILWASTFHDSIRGRAWLETLPLNIGRWAGNYSFFYVLNRILNDYKPQFILEFGLGESSKFVSTYLDNLLLNSKHLIIEQDENWKAIFENNFQLSSRSSIEVMPLLKKSHKEFDYNGYENIEDRVKSNFDLYIIDGPLGSDNFSRFDIYTLAERFSEKDEFTIIIDDYDRFGERQTTEALFQLFRTKNIEIYSAVYSGVKNVLIIGTEKYKYVESL